MPWIIYRPMPEFGIRCGFKIRCWKASGFEPQLGDQSHLFSFFMCFYTTRSTTPFKNKAHNRYLWVQVVWIKTVYIDWWCNREHALQKQVSYGFESREVKHSNLLAETVTNFILSASELIVAVVLSEVQWQVLSNQITWRRMRGEIQALE